jgi:Flp pilus assembly pilin Flp
VEYTALVAILLTGIVVTIGLVGGWISNQWANINADRGHAQNLTRAHANS